MRFRRQFVNMDLSMPLKTPTASSLVRNGQPHYALDAAILISFHSGFIGNLNRVMSNHRGPIS